MNNLLKIGLNQNLIDQMININGIYLVSDLNEKNVNAFKIINTLEQIGISKDNIDLLLIYMIKLFFIDYDEFIAKIKDKDLNEISDIINNNYEEAYDIFMK